jgi:hypothetical protein
MNYAISQKVVGSIPGNFIDFFFNLAGGKVPPANKADKLITVCEPTF